MATTNPNELKAVLKRQEAELDYAVHQCAIGWREENPKRLRAAIIEIGTVAEKVARDCAEALSGFAIPTEGSDANL